MKNRFAIKLISSQSWLPVVTVKDILFRCRAPFLSALPVKDGQCDFAHQLPGVSAALKELAKVFYEKTLNSFAAETVRSVPTVTDFISLPSNMAYAACIGRSLALVAPRNPVSILKLWASFRKCRCYAGVSFGHTAAVHTYEMGTRVGGYLHFLSHTCCFAWPWRIIEMAIQTPN